MKALPLLLLSFCLVPVLSADEATEALLHETASAYRGAEQYLFVASEQTVTASGEVRRETATMVVAAKHEDGRTRVEFDDRVNGGVAVFDGAYNWVYVPQANRYAQLPAGQAASQMPGGTDFEAVSRRYLQRYSGADERVIQASIVREEEVSLRDEDVMCDVVEIAYDPPPGLREGKIDRTYWIAKDSKLVVRERSSASMLQPNSTSRVTVTQEIDFQAAKVDEPLDEALFEFVPPPGASKAESLAGAASADPAPVDAPAPDFTLTTLDGESVQLSSLRGDVVLLDFWATWCGPCRYDMPHVDALYEEYKDEGLQVFGVNSERPEQARAYLESNGFDFPTLQDPGLRVAQLYRVQAIPTFVVIDREGKMTSYLKGTRSREQLRAALERAGL